MYTKKIPIVLLILFLVVFLQGCESRKEKIDENVIKQTVAENQSDQKISETEITSEEYTKQDGETEREMPQPEKKEIDSKRKNSNTTGETEKNNITSPKESDEIETETNTSTIPTELEIPSTVNGNWISREDETERA